MPAPRAGHKRQQQRGRAERTTRGSDDTRVEEDLLDVVGALLRREGYEGYFEVFLSQTTNNVILMASVSHSKKA